jgi:hypothetical protein
MRYCAIWQNRLYKRPVRARPQWQNTADPASRMMKAVVVESFGGRLAGQQPVVAGAVS